MSMANSISNSMVDTQSNSIQLAASKVQPGSTSDTADAICWRASKTRIRHALNSLLNRSVAPNGDREKKPYGRVRLYMYSCLSAALAGVKTAAVSIAVPLAWLPPMRLTLQGKQNLWVFLGAAKSLLWIAALSDERTATKASNQKSSQSNGAQQTVCPELWESTENQHCDFSSMRTRSQGHLSVKQSLQNITCKGVPALQQVKLLQLQRQQSVADLYSLLPMSAIKG